MGSKDPEDQTVLRLIKPIRTFTGLALIVGLTIAILGTVIGNYFIAFWGWILWAVFAFVPALLLGIEAILTRELVARILIIVGPGIRLTGNKARLFGVILILMAALGSLAAIILIIVFSEVGLGEFTKGRLHS
jgi:hypothetical protein